jgi:trimeric autotransporter adhesin
MLPLRRSSDSFAHRLVVPLFLVAAGAAPIAAQCDPAWLPGQSLPGVNGQIGALLAWDPDGSGPLTMRLAVAGSFSIAGDALVGNVASYDPPTRTWSRLGSGAGATTFTPQIVALAQAANGDLIAAGSFSQVDGVPAQRIARWNGATWQEVGGGLNAAARSVAVLANGAIVVAGFFQTAGTTPTSGLASFDGAVWTDISMGLGTSVQSMLALPNGDLVVCGAPGSSGLGPVRRFDGVTWSAVGTGLVGSATEIVREPNGDLLVAGSFSGGGNDGFARWNGANWSFIPLSSSWFGPASGGGGLLALGNGAFVTGGIYAFVNPGYADIVGLWDGSAWQALGGALSMSANGSAATEFARLPNGDIVAGGAFSAAGGQGAASIAAWNGSDWSALNDGPIASVHAVAEMPNGDRIVGGDIVRMDTTAVRNIARFDGTAWQPLGAGLDRTVTTLLPLPNGDLIAGGRFTSPQGVARWNGSAWLPLGPGLAGTNLPVAALLRLPNGDILAAGDTGVRRWDGSAWLPTGWNTPARCLFAAPDGSIYAGVEGATTRTVRRWNGVDVWTQVGWTFSGPINALGMLPDGELIAAGNFASAGGVAGSTIARWNGTLWLPFGGGIQGIASALAVRPNGDIVVGGSTALFGTSRLARWRDGQWSPLGSPSPNGNVLAMLQRPNGNLVIGGAFATVGGAVRVATAELASTCQASATAFGAGCPGASGIATLASTALPWLGASARARATAMPTNGIALGLLGLGSLALPLANVLPTAGPNCSLFTAPDVVQLLLPTAGTLDWTWLVPSSLALAGQPLFQQVVALELTAGSVGAATSTNRLTLILGAL